MWLARTDTAKSSGGTSTTPKVWARRALFGCACVAPASHGGSSLRVRGTIGERVRRRGSKRVIPACAGKQVSVDRTVDGHVGSSLRVRGTVRQPQTLRRS